VDKVTDVVNVGDHITVKVTEVDERGRVNLSRKAVLNPEAEDKDDRPPRPRRFHEGRHDGRHGGKRDERPRRRRHFPGETRGDSF